MLGTLPAARPRGWEASKEVSEGRWSWYYAQIGRAVRGGDNGAESDEGEEGAAQTGGNVNEILSWGNLYCPLQYYVKIIP
jgi:hypothetical protein